MFTKFHVKPSVRGDLKIYLNGRISVFKMVAIPKDVENHLKIFIRTKKALKLSFSIEHCGRETYHLC